MARFDFSLLLAALLVTLLLFSAVAAARENPEGVHEERLQGKANEEVAKELAESKEVVMPKALCGYQSKTFSGQCVRKSSCVYQCQVVEHAAAGACHYHHVQRHCYCYRYC